MASSASTSLARRAEAGLAVLLTPLAILVTTWTARDLAQEAFIAGASCAAVALWASAVVRDGRPGAATIALVAAGLVGGLVWWGGWWDLLIWWAAVALLALVPSVIVVPGLVLGVLLTHSWRMVHVLALWSGLILVPGFVGVTRW